MARSDYEEFSAILSKFEESGELAPSSRKARLYCALVRQQQESGPQAWLQDAGSAEHAR